MSNLTENNIKKFESARLNISLDPAFNESYREVYKKHYGTYPKYQEVIRNLLREDFKRMNQEHD
jgi:hypothetical protein